MSETKPFHNYEAIVPKLKEVIGHGLVAGLGKPEPGALCINAARRLVMGLPHGDSADECVGVPDRAFTVTLNDAPWSSNEARAAGMVDLAVAYLGSATMTQEARKRWANYLAEQTIRRVLPIALRAAGLEAEASRCEQEGTQEAAAAAAGWAAAAAEVAAAAGWAAARAAEVAAAAGWAAAAAAAAAAAGDAPLIESAKIAVEAYALVREEAKNG